MLMFVVVNIIENYRNKIKFGKEKKIYIKNMLIFMK